MRLSSIKVFNSVNFVQVIKSDVPWAIKISCALIVSFIFDLIVRNRGFFW